MFLLACWPMTLNLRFLHSLWERCGNKQAALCKTGLGRVAVLLIDGQEGMKLSSAIPVFIHSWHIVLFWPGTIRLSVSTVSVYWQCIIFWWDVLTYNQLAMMYLEMSVWWSHYDSIPNSLFNLWGNRFLPEIHFSFLARSLLLLILFII